MRAQITIWLTGLLLMSCSDKDSLPVDINALKTYSFLVWSASPTTDGGFLLNCANDVKKINRDGAVEWTYPLTTSSREEQYFVSQSFANASGIFILSSHLSYQANDALGPHGEILLYRNDSQTLHLQLHKLSEDGQVLWQKEYFIATVDVRGLENEAFFRQKVNFYIESNNYGLGAQAQGGDLFAVVSYDDRKGSFTRARLMHFTANGELIQEKDVSLDGFQARVYAVAIDHEELIVVSGDSFWYQFAAYNGSFDVVRANRQDTDMQDPTFTNVLLTADGRRIYTGHWDQNNSERFVTNFECVVAEEQAGAMASQEFGTVNTRDLCFGSALTANGNITLLHTTRPDEGVVQNARSGISITVVDAQNREPIRNDTVSVGHGMEGKFIQALSEDDFMVIGTQRRFEGSTSNSFFMHVRINRE